MGMIPSRICPRCGERFSYIEKRRIGNNEYLYAVHVTRGGGKRRVKKCYLGPSGSYIQVSRFQRDVGLELKGPADRNRAIEYMNSLVNYITSNYREVWGSDETVASALRDLASRLLDVAGRISPQTLQPAYEKIELSGEDYSAIMQYHAKGTWCPESVRKRARELFERIFSKGEKILIVR